MNQISHINHISIRFAVCKSLHIIYIYIWCQPKATISFLPFRTASAKVGAFRLADVHWIPFEDTCKALAKVSATGTVFCQQNVLRFGTKTSFIFFSFCRSILPFHTLIRVDRPPVNQSTEKCTLILTPRSPAFYGRIGCLLRRWLHRIGIRVLCEAMAVW